MGVFQILWVYYGMLILSRPVIVWNMVAVLINFLSVSAYLHFARKENRPASDSIAFFHQPHSDETPSQKAERP